MFQQAMKSLVLSGFSGWLSVLGLAGALVLTVAMCATSVWVARGDGLLRHLRALTITALLVSAAAAAHLAVDARQTMLSVDFPLGGYPFWSLSPQWRLAALQVERCFVVIGLAILVGGIMVIFPDARAQARSAGGSCVVRGYTAGVAAVTAMGILRRTAVATAEILQCERDFASCVDHVRLTAALPIAVARAGVLALTVAALAFVTVLAVRNRSPRATAPTPSSDGFVYAAVVFTLGVIMYQSTRAPAHDAGHPLPTPGPAQVFCAVPPGTALFLPPAATCEATTDGPVVDMMSRAPAIDGVHVRDASELLELLRAKRRLWSEVTGKPLPSLVLAAPASARMDDLAPYLAAVRDTWGSDVTAMSIISMMDLSTKSLGRVGIQPRCCLVKLRLAERNAETPSLATWGAVVQFAVEAPNSATVGR